MAIETRRFSSRDLVNIEEGEISREVFVNDEIYKQELEQIFTRTWLFVGHESQVPNPDDYFVSSMGEESVLLTRDKQNNIHVLLNTCRHRGMKVCRYDEGNVPVFSCPYHGWSYSTDGNLVKVPGQLLGVPHYNDMYQAQLDKQKWGLIQPPHVVNYKGSIWANWDPDAPSFEEYLGNMKLYLDLLLDHRDGSPGGSEVIGGVLKWRFPANWKFSVENFTPDGLHTISHRSVEMVGIGPGGPGQTRAGD
ncbi:MAG TPA: Rieske 2Fe-2S domain-containing protein, partial [Dehalococcoidia bacterium]|nr:Rieske 2Fe-2S domain-containing protein [Dehalococcoidia bacterium]